jgi:hypothetical protein
VSASPVADEADLVAELQSLGFSVNSVYDFVSTSAGYAAAYPILVRHLRILHHPRIREGITRALTVKDGGPTVIAALFAEFESETDPILKWTFANALKTAMPYRDRKRHPEIQDTFGRGARS